MLAPLRHFAIRLRRDRKGSMSALAVAGLVVAVAGAALAIDVGKIYAIRAELETTADAAALAAAVRLPDLEEARATALRYAIQNMPVSKYGTVVTTDDIEFGHWTPETRKFEVTTDKPSAVRVKAHYDLADASPKGLTFASYFGLSGLNVAADAVAGKAAPPCIISLDTLLPKAVKLTDQARLEAVGCGVQVNNRRAIAMEVADQSSVRVDAACVSGGVQIDGSASSLPVPEEFCPQAPDPLAYLEPIVSTICNHNDKVVDGQIATLTPGVYCGGLEIKNNAAVTFLPGIYIIKNGKFSVTNNSSIHGDEVGFFFDGRLSLIYFENGIDIDLAAPRSGDMEGILFFQRKNIGGLHIWNSDKVSRLTGTIYLPRGQILSSGDSLLTPVNSCNVIIAARLSFRNKSGLSVDISNTRCRNLLPAPFRRNVTLLD